MPHTGTWVSKPAVFMFLLVTVGLSAAAIASGIAERENRVYDISGIQHEIRQMTHKADDALDYQEARVCDLIRGVNSDLDLVCDITNRNVYRGQFKLGYSGADCSRPDIFRRFNGPRRP